MRTRFSPIAIGFLALTTASALRAQCGEASLGTSLTNTTYADDLVTAIQPLGFPFPFNGTTYTDVHISTNGFLYLSNAGTPAPGGSGCCAGSTTALVAGSPIIAPMWNDLVTDPANGGEVMYNALPGRAVITWLNSREYQDANVKTFQVQLLATGEIWMTYDSRCNVHVTGDMLVGMSEGAGASLPAASDFAAVNTSSTTTNFELFNAAGSFDLAGQAVQFLPTSPGYAWVPQVCPPGVNLAYGRGCYEQASSFYQLTAAPAASSAALSNTAITLVPNGPGYVVTSGGTFVAPTGAATPLALIDDSSVASPALSTPFPYPGGTTSSLQVCSNGSVWVAAGNSIAYAPDVTTMLSTNLQTGWYAWHDYNPAAVGSGQVKFEQIGSVAYVTWDGVYNYGGTTAADASYLQFQFDTATGTVVIAFGTVSANVHTGFTLGQPHLVGYSPGGPSVDLGSLVFAADLPYSVNGVDSPAMSLSASPTPALGTTMTYTVVDLPQYAPASGIYLTTLFLSVLPLPGGFDLGLIGAPDCNAYIVTLDVDMGGQLSFTPTASWNLSIAPSVFAVGNVLAAQAVALVVPNSLPNGQNAFGMTVSNGLQSTVGAW